MPRVLMLVNDIDSKPGTLVPWLLENHVEFDLRIGGVSDFPEPAALADYDGLVLLGGGYMPDEVDRAPWLAPEQALVAEAFRLDLPQLGICLGGQMLAYVGGGEVKAKTGAVEKGYTPITLTPAAGEDPVFSGVRPATEFVESHQDRITALPQDAVLLASSETCEIQAFRLGRAWGTQFHPEAGVDNLRRWNAERLAASGFDKEELIAHGEAITAEVVPDARAIVDAFCTVVKDVVVKESV
ncbi:type 1 glutamine amidotransferase [Brevibacterium samyangense]|uniref:Type 1 glutamine amidotransferase n=1 Tax=Brevibacterium samyangense TaxID=366888 RepID=A0ABP5F199_9MICO